MTILNHLPLTESHHDKLNFEPKSKEISKFIKKFPSHFPCAISVNGSWGSGKSTMLNFIEKDLRDSNVNVIRFNPWMITDRDSLIKNLFEEIYYSIDDGYDNLKSKFIEYAKKIIPSATKAAAYAGAAAQGIDPNGLSILANSAEKTSQGISQLLFDKPLSKRKNDLSKELNRIFYGSEEKIVVIIDELDRVFPKEILVVFQMMNAVLNLPGIHFVIAMDDKAINEALTSEGFKNPEYYLQKIFQKKYYIQTDYQLRTLTTNVLKSVFDIDNTSYKALNNNLEAFIYTNQNKWITVLEDEKINGYISELASLEENEGADIEYMVHSLNDINSSYWKLFNLFSEELNLQNPRKFIKLVDFIYENWEEYYKILSSRNYNSDYEMQAAFLMLLAYYEYPIDFHYTIFDNRYSLDKEAPEFLIAVRNHLNLTLPGFNIKQGNRTRRERKTEIIKIVDSYFNKFPDYNHVDSNL
ncbi:P-loop NTPase fold protein [Planococcus sp. SSTMD024]|uniref:KAP family P-loop NTPase fold protein n=1 Tax=Planococcus sp. SSTMD024 TaxID=3242163 RepID=UPI00351F3413